MVCECALIKYLQVKHVMRLFLKKNLLCLKITTCYFFLENLNLESVYSYLN